MALHSNFVDTVTDLDQAELNELFRGAGEVNDGNLILANNRFYQGQDSGLVLRNLIGIDGTDNLIVGYSGATLSLSGTFATAPVLANNQAWTQFDSGAVARNLIGIDNADLMTIGAAVLDVTILGAQLESLPPMVNATAYRVSTVGAVATDAIKMNSSDEIEVGSGTVALNLLGTTLDQLPPLPNTVALRMQDSNPITRDALQITAGDVTQLGYTGASVSIEGTTVSIPNAGLTVGGGALDVTGAVTATGAVTLANNQFYRGTEVGATVRDLLGMNASDEVVLGAATNDLQILGDINNAVTFKNNVPIQAEDAGGTARQLMRFRADDIMEFGESGFTFTFAGTFDMSPADRLMANNVFLRGEQVDTTARNLLGMNVSDVIELGAATNDITFNSDVTGNIEFALASELTWGGDKFLSRTTLAGLSAVRIGDDTPAGTQVIGLERDVYVAQGMVVRWENGSAQWVEMIGYNQADDVLQLGFTGSPNITSVDVQAPILYVGGDGSGRFTNTSQTIGLTVNNNGNTNDAIAVIDNGASIHTQTSHQNDAWASLRQISASYGLSLFGISSGGVRSFEVDARAISGSTTVSTLADGCIYLDAKEISGTSVVAFSGGENILVVGTNGTSRFIFQENGDAHADVAWLTFDDYDDVSLVRTMNNMMSGLSREQKSSLEHLGLFTFHESRPGGFLNLTRAVMLLFGTVLQIEQRLRMIEEPLR